MTFSRRASWLVRTGWPPLLWGVTGAAALLRGLLVEVDGWLPVHLVLLGAVSNVVLVWSSHFTNAVLRTPDDGRAGLGRRLLAFNAGAVLVVVGAVHDVLTVVVVGATLVAVAVLAQTRWLIVSLRRSLPARFAPTVRYYLAAASMLLVGICLGVALEAGAGGDEWAPRILVAHLTTNLVGWVSLTVVGTLVTLWPTMLRTPMGSGSGAVTFSALPAFVLVVAASVLGALFGQHVVAALGALAFLIVLAWAARPFVDEARAKPPHDFATRSVLAGCAWLVVGIGALAGIELLVGSWDVVADLVGSVVLPALVLGYAVQVVVGALAYLVPVMLGGGPDAVRRSIARVERAGRSRFALLNTALVVGLLAPWPAARTLAIATSVGVALVDAAVLVRTIVGSARSATITA